jgi:hypothetical protein
MSGMKIAIALATGVSGKSHSHRSAGATLDGHDRWVGRARLIQSPGGTSVLTHPKRWASLEMAGSCRTATI